MLKFENGVGLVPEELKSWRDEIEKGVWAVGVSENVLVKSKELDAVGALRVYVADAKERMGPSFLELAAGMLSDGAVREALGLGIDGRCVHVSETAPTRSVPNAGRNIGEDVVVNSNVQVSENAPTPSVRNAREDVVVNSNVQVSTTVSTSRIPNTVEDVVANSNVEVSESAPTPSVRIAGEDVVANNCDTETHKESELRRRKNVAHKRTSRRAKIVDTEDVVVETSHNRYGCIPTPEVNKVQEALEVSSLDLQAVVTDPLPDAINVADSVIVNMARESVVHGPVVGNHDKVDVPSSSVGRSGDPIQADGSDVGHYCCGEKNSGPKSSLMPRNSTARTIEWDDSIDSSEEGSPRRPHLPTPQCRVVSPLKKVARRRKNKRWSILEEDTLRTGVQKYGKGNWKAILNTYPDIFEDRTEVDLKDKWRNMMR